MVVAATCGVALLGSGGGVALASAKNKNPGYESHADASAGFVLLPAPLPALVEVGHSSSSSDVDDGGASGSSSGHALGIGGVIVVGEADCASTGTDNEGVDRSTGASGTSVPVGPVAIDLLWADCDASAVQSNNAHPSASAGVARVTIDQEGSPVTEVELISSSSSTDSTSGQTRSHSESTVLGIDGETLVGCSSSAAEGNPDSDGQPTTGSQSGDACALFGAVSSAQHERT